jgi:ArsR family metal-binding transcriptional regulator
MTKDTYEDGHRDGISPHSGGKIVGFMAYSGYNRVVNTADKLITDYRFELVEDHHSFGSGRYGGRIILPADISASFPYLNTVLDDTIYDHENSILIGFYNHRRYAFRPHEIQLGMVENQSEASSIADEVVGLVNRLWSERESTTPSFQERKLPTIYDIYKLLPGTNCKECGYTTCLACAADIRNGAIVLEICPLLSKPEYAENREQIRILLSSDQINKKNWG